MKNYYAIAAALTALLAISTQSVAQTLYQDPIKIQTYVTNPAAAVKEGMQRYSWLVESEDADGLIAKLEYKNYILRVAITYTNSLIEVKSLSEERVNCVVSKRETCEVDQDYIDRWRSNLRRGITKSIHDLAIADAYVQLSKQQ